MDLAFDRPVAPALREAARTAPLSPRTPSAKPRSSGDLPAKLSLASHRASRGAAALAASGRTPGPTRKLSRPPNSTLQACACTPDPRRRVSRGLSQTVGRPALVSAFCPRLDVSLEGRGGCGAFHRQARPHSLRAHARKQRGVRPAVSRDLRVGPCALCGV